MEYISSVLIVTPETRKHKGLLLKERGLFYKHMASKIIGYACEHDPKTGNHTDTRYFYTAHCSYITVSKKEALWKCWLEICSLHWRDRKSPQLPQIANSFFFQNVQNSLKPKLDVYIVMKKWYTKFQCNSRNHVGVNIGKVVRVKRSWTTQINIINSFEKHFRILLHDKWKI